MWPFRKKSPPSRNISDDWERYLCAGVVEKDDFRDLFQPGATSDQIQSVEDLTGFSLPDDYRALLSINNGQIPDSGFGLPGWEFYPAQRVCAEWEIWVDLRTSQFVPEGYTCSPQNSAIRSDEWWRKGWLPFCGDGGGNHLCLDMDPTPSGRAGQVITFWHDNGERILVAPTLIDFIREITRDLESGQLVWNEDWGGIYMPFDEN